jgi:hypothetical protein
MLLKNFKAKGALEPWSPGAKNSFRKRKGNQLDTTRM